MSTLKITSALFLSTLIGSTAALASSGIELASVMVRGETDTVRVEYSSKTKGCEVILDKDGAKVQARPNFFCRNSLDLVRELPFKAVPVEPGEWVQMCTIRNITNCSDWVQVREAGDVNNDGAINVIDLQLVGQYIMGTEPRWFATDWENILAADVNGDGAVNVIDVMVIYDTIMNGE
jgi:hypothetical protein